MSARHSREVTDRIRSGNHLLSAFDVEGPRVAACYLDETRPHLEEGDEEPRPGGFLVAAGRTVRSSLGHLVEADFAVVRAEGWESTQRKQFREDKRQLAFTIVAFRRLVRAQYVEPDLENLGLAPVNVRDGITILRRGELVGERFEAPNLAKMLGKSRFGEPLDLGPWVAEIRKKSAALSALSVEIDEAHRASDRARIARSRAKDDFDRAYLRAARIFEDICRFCGLDDLAARIRRRESRPATSEDSVPESLEGKVPQLDQPAPDLPAVPVGPRAEVPGPARGRSGASDPQPPAANRLARPPLRQGPGLRSILDSAIVGGDRGVWNMPIEHMPSRQRRYRRNELARRGDEIYEHDIRSQVEAAHRGEFVVIDIDTGEFEVDSDELAASDRLLSRLPEAQVWLKRVGHPYVRHFGPRRRYSTA